MGSTPGERGVGLSSEYGEARDKADFPPCTGQVGIAVAYIFFQIGGFTAKAGSEARPGSTEGGSKAWRPAGGHTSY